MQLAELEIMLKINKIGGNTLLPFGLADVFSWRGNYADVAFSIKENVSVNTHNSIIKHAYRDMEGYRGGNYSHDGDTEVFFSHCEASADKNQALRMQDKMLHFLKMDDATYQQKTKGMDLSESICYLLLLTMDKTLN